MDMKRNDDFLLKNVGGQDILVPLAGKVKEMNCLFSLNAAGRCVWEHLSEDVSIEDLVHAVAEQFDVDKERVRADIQVFLDDIRRIGLLES